MAVTGSYGFNPLQDLKSKVKQTVYGYDDAAADRFSKQGQLYTYLLSIEKLGKTKEDWENFNNTYKMFDYMSDDYKDFALMNEAQYKPNNYTEEELSKLSDEERKIYNEQTKKTLRTWTDENGQQVSQEMTDYDWNKKLLEWKGEDIQQELVKKQFEELQASKNWFQKAFEKVIAIDEAILRNVVTGALDAVGDLYNLLEGVVSAAGAAITGNDVEAWWREAVGTNELAFIGEAMERATFDWERQWGVRDYYGNKDWFGNMADGIANSFGRMAPTMLISWGGSSLAAAKGVKAGISSANLLNAVDNTSKTISAISKTSQLLFYASMAQSDITEMLNDEATASLPTWQIFASAYASAGMELLVEKGLDKLLGTSVLDSMLYGFNASSKGVLSKAGKEIGKLTKGKVAATILGRMAADAFHEGMEEVLQDWSHVFVNGFFETLNYVMGNTEYANIFHDANTFSFQTAIDAFVSGAVMSVIGSGFDYIKTKRLGLASVTTDSKGNVKQEKLSKARSWLYKDAMASIDSSVHELLDSGKLTLEEKTDLISGLNTSMKTISAIFEGMGQERFAQANKLLQAMNDTMLSKQHAASEVYSFVKDVWTEYGVKRLAENAKKFEERQLDKPIYNVSRESELDEIREATAIEKDTIKQIFADCANIENVIATKEGTGAILTDDNTLIVPAAQLANLDAATIEKDINEQIIVSQITNVPQLKVVIDQIFKTFKELPINKDKRNLSKETAITYLLLNPDFARTCLYTGDVNIVQFISQLDKLVASLEVSDTLTAQHKKMLYLGIDNLKQIYADYCKSMQYADINVDILSEAQRQEIIKERWNKDLANRIDQGLKLSAADKRNLEARINTLIISDTEKTELRNNLFVTDLNTENKTKRDIAFKQLAQLQYGQFYSLFDDITYPKSRTLPNLTLYNFLRSQGITLQDLRTNKTLNIDGESVKARDYYKQQFETFTDGVYSLVYGDKVDIKIGNIVANTKSGFTVTVIENNASKFGTVEKGYAVSRIEYNKVTSKTGIRSADSNFDRSILKSDINSAYKGMISIDDVIHTPSMLTDDIRKQIKDKYGSLSPTNVYEFLQQKFLTESKGNRSISRTADGTFVMTDLVQANKMLSKKLADTAEDIRIDITNTGRGAELPSYTIGDFINSKFLHRADDKAINVEIKNVQNHYYDANTNSIVLSFESLRRAAAHMEIADFKYIVQSAVLHEFTHALQVHNRLVGGTDSNIVANLSKTNINKIATDLQKYIDIKEKITANLISDILYFNTGEAGAYGYEYDFKYDNIPISSYMENNKVVFQMPWGTEYVINPSDNSLQIRDANVTIVQQTKKPTKKSTIVKEPKQLSREGETEQTTEADTTEADTSEKSTGFQMTSEEYSEYQKAKAKLAKQKKEAYAKRSYVSKTREANTNLKYYAGQNINSDIQNIIRSTTGYEKAYDKALIEKIKDGDFRTKSDVYEYVRKHNMNENTFNLLNKQYFKNINITSAEQLSKLVEMSGNYYALRAAIRSMGDALDIDVSNYLYGQMNAKSLNELLRRLKNEAPNAFKIYQDVLSRYQGYRSKSVEDFLSQDLSKMSPEEKVDYEKKKKIIEARESKQTQVDTELLKVAYLNGYDGTLESAARIANWARQLALTPELKRTGEISTVSMEKSIKDTKGDNLTIGERIADTYSFESDFEDFPWAADDVRTMAQDIYQNRFAEYLNRIVGKDNMYLATKELQAVLKQKGIDYKTVLAEKQRILDEVSKLSTEQVIEEYRSMEIEEVFDVKVKVRADLQRNLTQKANRVIKALANKKKAFAKLVEMYPDLGFTTDKEWHMPTKNGKLLNQDEMYVLSKQLSQILKYANAGAFDPLVQAQKEKLVKQQEMISELKKKQSDLQRELKLTKQARKNTYQQIEDIKFNTTEFTMQSTRAMPEKFKQVLDTVFTKLAKTKGKFTNINEYHTIKNYDEWVDANIETLSSLTEYEANEILDYILNSTPVYAKFGSDDYVRYQAISIFMTSYLYARQADLKINTSLLMQAEEMFDNIQSASGTIMKISQGLMNKVDITGKTLKMLSKQSGVDFRQSDIDELAHIIDKHKDAKTEAEVKDAIEEYQAQYRRMSQRLLADYKDSDKRNAWSKLQSFQKMAMLSSPGTWLRNITSNVILQKTDAPLAKLGQFFFGKISKIADKWDTVGKRKLVKPEFDTKYDQGLNIANEYYNFDIDNFTDDDMKQSITLAIKERNEAIKVKNATGDMLKYYHSQIADIDERIGALKYAQSTADATQRLILAGRIEALQRKSLMFANPDYIIHQATQAIDALEEYKIYRSKLEKYEAKVKGNPLRRTLTNQYKLIGTEVDAKTAEFVQTMVIDSGLFDMIKDGLNKFNPNSKVNTAESKITKLIMDSVMNNVFMNNQFDSKTMNKMSQLLFKVLSDEKWINKTFVSYLGKMLVEDKVDLTKGLSSQVMETIANAYSYAAYTYMHKSNFMNDIEKAIKDRIGPKAYFVYKQIFPFANASVNWWIEGLNWTPVGLAKAIRNIVNFDNYVSKMEANATRGRGPSERFAYYEVRRNLGKGIVGTTGFLAAMLAAAFGLIRLKEDDYGDLKITIGSGNAEVSLDFSEITGTTGFGWGLVIGNAIKGDDGFDIFADTLNMMFESSIFTDLYDMVNYNSTFGEMLTEMPERIIKTFIPNIIQVFNSSLYSQKIKYSSGVMGMLERCAVKLIPGIAYAMPTKYDIYTGELQYKYYPNMLGWVADLVSRFGPVKIGTAKISPMERIAESLDIHKGQLNGKYEDIGNFSSEQVAKLNEMYGSLNKNELDKLVNNKQRYRVQDKKTGKYVEKYYRNMTDEEKSTVIKRVMSNNSTYAKIYVWTSEGHKYYCSSSEYTALAKLGITKNVYRTSNSKQLMNKFVK